MIAIELAGRPRLRSPSLDAPLLLERRDAALIAWLALRGAAERARLAEWLWPDADIDRARNSLRQRLHRLKRSAGGEVITGDAVLQLAPQCRLDVAAPALRWRGDAAPSWPGELLDGLDYADLPDVQAWLQLERQRWVARRRELLAALVGELESRGELARALVVVEQMVAAEPLLEHAHRWLMRLHHERGDRGAALAAFERCRAILAERLGHSPDDETRTLAAQIAGGAGAPAPPRARAPLPPSLRRPPQLVGRDAAWRLLQQAAVSGQPVLLFGEPGIGKSRLVDEAVAAQPGACLVGGRPGDRSAPYTTLLRLLGALAERFGASPGDAVLAALQRERGAAVESAALRLALQRALDGWRSRGLALIAVDDLHHADAASVELCLSLVAPAVEQQRGGVAPLRWLFACRAAERPLPLVDWLRGQHDDALVEVTLAPLDALELTRFVDSLALPGVAGAAWARRLLAHAGGNPMLTLATLADLWRDGDAGRLPDALPQPEIVRAALRRRLAELTPAARRLAELASVAGQDLSPELAATVLQVPLAQLAEPWAELEAAHVLDGAAFAHDLVRDAVVAALPRPLAQALHRQVAAWLAAHGATAGRLAEHWLAGERWLEAGDALDAAAAEAERLSRPREAVQHRIAAADAHRRAGRGARAFVSRWHAGHAMQVVADIDTALALADELCADAGDALQRARAHQLRAAIRVERVESQAALADADAADAALDELAAAMQPVEPLLPVRLARSRAGALIRMNRAAEAMRAMHAVRERALALADVGERLAWRIDLAMVLDYADRLEEAAAANRACADEARALQRWGALASALSNLGVALGYLGRLHDARAAFEEAIALQEQHQADTGAVWVDQLSLAGTYLDLGDFERGLALNVQCVEQLGKAGHVVWATHAATDQARAYLWLGRPDLALKAVRPLPDDAPALARGAQLLMRARIAEALGQSGRALGEQGVALLETAGRAFVRLKAELERARHLAPADGGALALDVARRADDAAQRAAQLQALLLAAQQLLAAGQTRRAADAARSLLDLGARTQPFGTYGALPPWAASQALRADGDAAGADRALALAREWVAGALPNVPALYRTSFLQRNPVNAAIARAVREHVGG